MLILCLMLLSTCFSEYRGRRLPSSNRNINLFILYTASNYNRHTILLSYWYKNWSMMREDTTVCIRLLDVFVKTDGCVYRPNSVTSGNINHIITVIIFRSCIFKKTRNNKTKWHYSHTLGVVIINSSIQRVKKLEIQREAVWMSTRLTNYCVVVNPLETITD